MIALPMPTVLVLHTWVTLVVMGLPLGLMLAAMWLRHRGHAAVGRFLLIFAAVAAIDAVLAVGLALTWMWW